jgi:hypothetical protein
VAAAHVKAHGRRATICAAHVAPISLKLEALPSPQKCRWSPVLVVDEEGNTWEGRATMSHNEDQFEGTHEAWKALRSQLADRIDVHDEFDHVFYELDVPERFETPCGPYIQVAWSGDNRIVAELSSNRVSIRSSASEGPSDACSMRPAGFGSSPCSREDEQVPQRAEARRSSTRTSSRSRVAIRAAARPSRGRSTTLAPCGAAAAARHSATASGPSPLTRIRVPVIWTVPASKSYCIT